MIDTLALRDVGVIESAELDFPAGLTVITGETGAGKTMLLTAIALIAGERADASRVRKGAARATVDAVLTDTHHPERLATIAEQVDAELDDGALLIGRTVPAQGRARASLGGRQVPAGVLRDLAETYITIHGQSEQLKLRQASFQRTALDDAGGEQLRAALTEYRAAFETFQEVDARLAALRTSSTERAQRRAALTSGVSQIDQVDPKVGEDDNLRLQAERLTNIDELRRLTQTAYAALDTGETSAVERLGQAAHALRSATEFDAELGPWAEELTHAATLASEIAGHVTAYAGDLAVEPGQLDTIHARRAEISALLRIYGPTIEDALAWRDAAQAELASSDDSPEAMARLRDQHERCSAALEDAANRLREERTRVATRLADAIGTELAELGMASAKVRIRVEPQEPASHGADEITFELRAHAGAPYRPIGQGASGGELSRLMLALEVCLADASGASGHTFVFDEIDAGIGGATATKVGARLARLALHHQVLVVTHVAQVAAFATGHVRIVKDESGSAVRTRAEALQGAERTREIARMLGGTDSETAMRHAAELVNAANVGR
ncbi:MAG: DNA repair protein RecN [Bowdeniella nasicola]|nr:DNA repair protein RecN [Bowdeniella nasicola]